MQKWEYLHVRSVKFNFDNDTWVYQMNGNISERGPEWQLLNELGEEGWNLVSTYADSQKVNLFILKRPKSPATQL